MEQGRCDSQKWTIIMDVWEPKGLIFELFWSESWCTVVCKQTLCVARKKERKGEEPAWTASNFLASASK